MGETYAGAGVDIEAGDEAVRRIAPVVRSTFRPEVLADIGGFGASFALDVASYRAPVLVSATDGVGTKAQIAEATGHLETIGIDLVAMCVDDLVCQGAEPLFFLDYVAVGHLDPDRMEHLVAGVAEGCRQAGCSLIGGEMAEHPGVMAADQFDLVGFAVGVVERDRLLTGDQARAGDVLIGLPSPGLRSNGYSLARRVLLERAGRSLDEPAFEGSPRTLGEELLEPSVIYAPAVLALLDAVDVRAVAHVTGGGLAGNLPRVLPDAVDAHVDPSTWEQPRIFAEVQAAGAIDDAEMAAVFNLGIGMVVAVPAEVEREALDVLGAHGHRAVTIGGLTEGSGEVHLAPGR